MPWMQRLPEFAVSYPREMVTYFNTQTEVLVGDYVEVKVWLEFWRGWQPGRVWYVPGVSPQNPELEHHDLTWVAIHYGKGKQCGNYADGEQCGSLVEPSTGQLQKSVRFVRRADDGFTQTPEDYYFGDDEEQWSAFVMKYRQDRP